MNITLPRPPKTFSQNDLAQTRRQIEQAFAQAAQTAQLGIDTAVAFAELPPDPPRWTRRIAIDRGANGLPLWWTGTDWIDAAGTIVT